ncbi:MAG: hypothetical protein EOM88_02830 [Clostridia bacterium]|nr:hypothetical protein [Clostridia bacterium]
MRLNAKLKFKVNKKIIAVALLVVLSSFLIAQPVYANWVSDIIGGILGALIWAVGQIVILVMRVLLAIAQYQDFISPEAVKNGWEVVRDLSNMFFVVILLIISFATILHIESYNYKKWLPRLILMAVLINFSKTICGLLIDIAQVVMLTFVNSFRDIAGGNFVEMLGIKAAVTAADGGAWNIIGAYILGLIYIIIALVVLTTMTMILAMRIVMIWIYVVLSPLAYLLQAFPGGAQYASKWWKGFTENLIVGPVLAFFIWLSFATLQTNTGPNFEEHLATTKDDQNIEFISSADTEVLTADAPSNGSEASKPSVLIKFIMGVGMLIGGMKMAQEAGGAAGSIAGKGMAKINKMASSVTSGAGNFAKNRAKGAGRVAGMTALGLASGAAQKLGKTKVAKKMGVSSSLSKIGDVGLDLKKDLREDHRKRKVGKRKKFLRSMGASDETADKFANTFRSNRKGDKEDDKDKRKSQAVANVSSSAIIGASLGSFVAPVLGTAIGGALGAGFGLLQKFTGNKRDNAVRGAKEEVNKKQDNLVEVQKDYTKKLADNNGNEQAPDVVEAKAKLTESQLGVKEAKENLKTTEGKGESFTASINRFLDQFAAGFTGLTSEAAEDMAKDNQFGRNQVDRMAKNTSYLAGADKGAIGSSSGQTARHKSVVTQLTNPDNRDAPQARANLETEINSYDHNARPNPVFVEKLNLLSENIAASDKAGDDVSSLAGIIAALDGQAGKIGDSDKLNTYENHRENAISYRKTDQQGQQGDGKLYVDSMGGGEKGELKEGHEAVGLDFNKLQEQGFAVDASAEGFFVEPKDMAQFGAALSQLINEARGKLEEAHNNNEISDDDYTKKSASFDRADEKIKDGSFNDSGMMAINSASANFGRQAKLTSVYHEAVHKGGIEDEGLAEGIAVALMNAKLYGRNAETGGSHISEITELAKAMKEGGSSNDDILKAMSANIADRSKNEAGSRAKKVLEMEQGKALTQTEELKREVEGTSTTGEGKEGAGKEGAGEEGADKLVEQKIDLTELNATFKEFKEFIGRIDPSGGQNYSGAFASIQQAIKSGDAGQMKALGAIGRILKDTKPGPVELDSALVSVLQQLTQVTQDKE